jgi:hypothetical protein
MFDTKTIRGLAAVYTLLFVCVIGAGLGAYATYSIHTVKAQVKAVQAAVGDQNLVRQADKAITQTAQQQGFGVIKIVVKSVKTDGDKASVDAVVTVTDGVSPNQTVELVVSFNRSTWQVDGLQPK